VHPVHPSPANQPIPSSHSDGFRPLPENFFMIESIHTAYVHRGCPSFLRAQLREARSGGNRSYEHAGFALGQHLEDEVPIDAELDEWAQELDALESFVDDDAQFARWLRGTFPRILASVPTRRMRQFMSGVRRGRADRLGC
jgi:hypothetical protein